jgi:hypothetical protein
MLVRATSQARGTPRKTLTAVAPRVTHKVLRTAPITVGFFKTPMKLPRVKCPGAVMRVPLQKLP